MLSPGLNPSSVGIVIATEFPILITVRIRFMMFISVILLVYIVCGCVLIFLVCDMILVFLKSECRIEKISILVYFDSSRRFFDSIPVV